MVGRMKGQAVQATMQVVPWVAVNTLVEALDKEGITKANLDLVTTEAGPRWRARFRLKGGAVLSVFQALRAEEEK